MTGEADDAKAGPHHATDAMFEAGIGRARRLVEELERKAADLEKNPPNLSPDDIQAGIRAMAGALAAARRVLLSLLSARDAMGGRDPQEDE